MTKRRWRSEALHGRDSHARGVREGIRGCRNDGGKDAGVRLRHLIAEYEEDGRAYAEAWVQVDLLDMCWCLWRRRIELRR